MMLYRRLALPAFAFVALRVLGAVLADGPTAALSAVLSAFLAAVALAVLAGVLRGDGQLRTRHVGLILSFCVAVSYVNPWLEVFLFHLQKPGASSRLKIMCEIVALAIWVPAIVKCQPPREVSTTRAFGFGWVWRVPLGILAYGVLYLAAGSIIYPFVRAFYEQQPLPNKAALLVMQVVRGAIFVAVAVPILRAAVPGRLRAGIAMGLALAVVGGVSLLIGPNAILPPAVRLVHAFEIGTSHLVYGVVLGALFAPRREPERE